MTAISQNINNAGISRRKQVMAAAFDSTKNLNLSDAFRRALLNKGKGGNNQPHKRPAFLRLYFALKAQEYNFPATSPAVNEDRRLQDAMKAEAQRKALVTRNAKHAMPPNLNEEGRTLWINARKQKSHALKASRKSHGAKTRRKSMAAGPALAYC